MGLACFGCFLGVRCPIWAISPSFLFFSLLPLGEGRMRVVLLSPIFS